MQRPSHIRPHCTYTVAKMLRRKFEMKINGVLGGNPFGFRRGQGSKDAIGMLRKYRNEVWTEKMNRVRAS